MVQSSLVPASWPHLLSAKPFVFGFDSPSTSRPVWTLTYTPMSDVLDVDCALQRGLCNFGDG